MRLLALLVGGLLAIAAPGAAVAQNNWVTPGNSTAGGSVQMCLNSAQQAVPCNPGSSGGPAVVQANAAGTTGAVNVTLPAVAGKTTYLCGFAVSAIGSGAVGPITISGLFGSSNPTFQGTATAAGGVVAQAQYNPCLPASATNQVVVVGTTADATASAVNVSVWGYQL
jgi:hypothetical protein